jgi:hypothetical protein
MRAWVKLLPWCVVVWLARKYSERFILGNVKYVVPFRDGPGITEADFRDIQVRQA